MRYEIPALDERPFQPSELLSNHPIRNGQATVPVRQAIIVNLAAFDATALARPCIGEGSSPAGGRGEQWLC